MDWMLPRDDQIWSFGEGVATGVEIHVNLLEKYVALKVKHASSVRPIDPWNCTCRVDHRSGKRNSVFELGNYCSIPFEV